MGIDHKKQIHLLPVLDQPLRYFKGYLPAHAESAYVVRPFRLQLAHLAQVGLGHRLSRRQVIAASVKASSLKPQKWIVRAKKAGQFAIDQDVAASAMHAEERRLGSSGLNRNQRIPARRPAVFPNNVRQFFNSRRLK